jgi:hypothetical protein
MNKTTVNFKSGFTAKTFFMPSAIFLAQMKKTLLALSVVPISRGRGFLATLN